MDPTFWEGTLEGTGYVHAERGKLVDRPRDG